VLFAAYNGILIPLRAAFPLYSLLARLRGVETAEIRERIGWIEPEAGFPLWIQAASVGEVGVAASLIAALGREVPGLRVCLTTTTRTGQTLARRLLGSRARFGYFPLDFPVSARRTMTALSPSVLLLVETEIWPNLLVEARRREVPILIVNGRLSDRAFRYYRLAAPLFARAMRCVSLGCLQTPLDAERFARIGLPPERIRVTGNVKFASSAAAPGGDPGPILGALGVEEGDELWVAGSTAEGEEEAVLAAFESLPPPLRGRRILVIAPRHPARFEVAARMLAASRLPWGRRSETAMGETTREGAERRPAGAGAGGAVGTGNSVGGHGPGSVDREAGDAGPDARAMFAGGADRGGGPGGRTPGEGAGDLVRDVETDGRRPGDSRGTEPRVAHGGGPSREAGSARVVLLDTLGELPSLYAAAAVAFVGGSLAPVGGHNIIEPAASGLAPVFGPHVQNFRDAAARLLEAGGAFQVRNPGELKDLFGRLAADKALRQDSGEKARRVVLDNAGSLEATVREILPYLRQERSARA